MDVHLPRGLTDIAVAGEVGIKDSNGFVPIGSFECTEAVKGAVEGFMHPGEHLGNLHEGQFGAQGAGASHLAPGCLLQVGDDGVCVPP